MDHHLINSNAGNVNTMNTQVSYSSDMCIKNDSMQPITPDVYSNQKPNNPNPYGNQNLMGNIDLNYGSQLPDGNVQYVQQDNTMVTDGNYTSYLVTSENTIISNAGDMQTIYTQPHTEMSFNPQTVVTTEGYVTTEQYIGQASDQNNFVSQYIQEAQAGSQYQVTAGSDNYIVTTSSMDSVDSSNVIEQEKEVSNGNNNEQNHENSIKHIEESAMQQIKDNAIQQIEESAIKEIEENVEEAHIEENVPVEESEEVTENIETQQVEEVEELVEENNTSTEDPSVAITEASEESQNEPQIEENSQEMVQEEVTETPEEFYEMHEQKSLNEEEIITNEESQTEIEEEVVEEPNASEETSTEQMVDNYVAEEENIIYSEVEQQVEEKHRVTLENMNLPEELEVTPITDDGQNNVHYEDVQMSADGPEHEILLIESYVEEEGATEDFTDNSSMNVEERKKGRKQTRRIPLGDNLPPLPSHIIGTDTAIPVDPVNGNKPRLGVKIPCKNLQSQIVTHKDIAKVIMDRSKQNEQKKADMSFARKLTYRLAQTIIPDKQSPKKKKPAAKPPPPPPLAKPQEQIIQDNSDLLAILEGDDVHETIIETTAATTNTTNTTTTVVVTQTVAPEDEEQEEDKAIKDFEKEVALKQLEDLATLTPTVKTVYQNEHINLRADAPALRIRKEQAKNKADKAAEAKAAAEVKKTVETPKKSDLPVKEKIIDAEPMEIEPQVKVNMVLKTYSRKRKSFETPTPEVSPAKKTAKDLKDEDEKEVATQKEVEMKNQKVEIKSPKATPVNVYMTKSSRVIKKKVIWDPDEAASPKIKMEATIVKVVPAKSSANKNSEKKEEVKPVEEKKVPEKKVEAKKIEKKPEVVKKVISSPEPKKLLTPKKPKTPATGKKRLTEVDKLLKDEGAVNMLYDLNNDDKKKRNLSGDKFNDEMSKRAKEVKNSLQKSTEESPKSLRKKSEGAMATTPPGPAKIPASSDASRKKSKDSSRGTPPPSPAYSYRETSRLIRRRSSSSISSIEDLEEEESSSSTTSTRSSRKKQNSESKEPKEISSPAKKPKKSIKEEPEPIEKPKIETPAPKPSTNDKSGQYKSFTIKKSGKLMSLDMNYIDDSCHCTVQVLKELIKVLQQFSKDKDCTVVSITSSGKQFCLGLDYKLLIADTADARKKKATELSGLVKDFLKCLLTFPKVLVAGIQGDCVGLGVTMLPLFDMVIASDTATFSTLNSTLGSVVEGAYLLATPHLPNRGLASELLFTSSKITADDAFRRGLITRLCWPEKYQQELKNMLSSIAKSSKQSILSSKKQLNGFILKSTEAAINAESSVLIEQWTSDECQKKIA